MKKILVFASGNGSNAEKIFQHFQNKSKVEVAALFCNNATAAVILKAEKFKIPVYIFSKEELLQREFLHKIYDLNPDLIVLSGFLLKIPEQLVQWFPNKIVNIHPSLLPKYGGKGMYGMKVHKAVFENHESETGITIHYVNEQYDEGTVIFHAKTDITDCFSPEDIAEKVINLEHEFFSLTIEKLLI